MGSHMIYDKCKNDKKDCFGSKDGLCVVLNDTRFINENGTRRPCPFYKRNLEVRKEELL